jgi:antitoxin CptB
MLPYRPWHGRGKPGYDIAVAGTGRGGLTSSREPRKDAARHCGTDPIMAPPEVAGEDLGTRRRRLRYRAWHRGTREMDMLLGPYADSHAEAMDEGELARFELLLEQADPDLASWLLGQADIPAGIDRALIAQLRTYHAEHR